LKSEFSPLVRSEWRCHLFPCDFDEGAVDDTHVDEVSGVEWNLPQAVYIDQGLVGLSVNDQTVHELELDQEVHTPPQERVVEFL